MAAKTPDSITRASMGDLTMIVAKFEGATTANSIDDADTWTSNIPSTVAHWCTGTDNPTTNTHGVDVGLTDAPTGEFTFSVGAANKTCTLFVLTHG